MRYEGGYDALPAAARGATWPEMAAGPAGTVGSADWADRALVGLGSGQCSEQTLQL